MAGPCAAIGFRNRDAEKPHFGEALPQFAVIRRLAVDDRAHRLGLAFFSEKFPRRIPQLLLLVGEIEIHGGSPSLSWVPALRRIVKNAAPRPGHGLALAFHRSPDAARRHKRVYARLRHAMAVR